MDPCNLFCAFLLCRNVTYLNPSCHKHIPELPEGVMIPKKVFDSLHSIGFNLPGASRELKDV